VEVQHPRHVNPRRVGKKKPLDPRPQQTPTKAKRNEGRRVESKILTNVEKARDSNTTGGHIQEQIKGKYAKPT
jgi:hypothetical protein